MKPKPESKPKAFIRPEYQDGRLPDGNPYGLPKRMSLPDKNTKEYKMTDKLVKEFLNRPHKGVPVAGSKIAF